MASPLDLTPYRLEAARNTGINAEFSRVRGRDFTGTVADYALLTQDQQLRLSEELGHVLQKARDAQPSTFSGSQAAAIEKLAAPPPPSPTLTGAFIDGAVEGLVNYPRTLATVVGETTGTLVQGATGGSLSGILTKVAIIAGIGGLLYAGITWGGMIRPGRRRR